MTVGSRRLLAESPAPRMDVARGFAVSAVEEQLLERFAAEPHTEEVDLGAHGGALRVLRWQLDPAVAEVAAPEPMDVSGAVIRTPAGTVLVDSRTELASLRFTSGGQELELAIERGHVWLYALEAERLALPAFEPRVATGGEELGGWLAVHVEALRESSDPLDTLAAVGALVRFFAPALPEDAGTGAPQVVRGARSWARSIDASVWARLEEAARVRAVRFEHVLDSLLADLEADGAVASRVVSLALERDSLESVAVAARLAGRGAALAEQLDAVDRRARVSLTALTERAPSTSDARLSAVSWSEPEAWWGTLAR